MYKGQLIFIDLDYQRMWTNEFEFDETITTVLDEDGFREDVHVFIDENEVFIRQWNNDEEEYELINMSHRMWYELQKAMQTTEGIFKLEYNR